jgi:hypothetical protein
MDGSTYDMKVWIDPLTRGVATETSPTKDASVKNMYALCDDGKEMLLLICAGERRAPHECTENRASGETALIRRILTRKSSA